MSKNKLYFGDNLEVMREMDNNSVNLFCADPPFNSGKTYCTFFDSQAQEDAFTDIWGYDDTTDEIRRDIRNKARGPEEKNGHVYAAVENALKGFDYLLQKKRTGNKGTMLSYLTYMAPRLVEGHRLLKDTGSFYLHCDPSASHYLKAMLDAIFDQKNNGKNVHFRNEIIWSYNKWTGKGDYFPRNHDIILSYSKTDELTFNPILNKEMSEQMKSNRKKGYVRQISKNRGTKQLTIYDRTNPKAIKQINSGEFEPHQIKYLENQSVETTTKVPDVWEFPRLGPNSSERLGYPTQKPRALYEQIIKAASNPGDLVFDPFCGCGTTIDAAQALNRHWVGIDLTICALDPMQERLMDRYDLKPYIDYEVIGYPTNMEELNGFIEHPKRRYDAEIWLVTRVGLKPTKPTGDGGYDGIGHFTYWVPEGMLKTEARIMAEVKTGNFSLGDVRSFRTAMRDKNATAGVFITCSKEVTKGMKEEAVKEGEFEHNGIKYPRLQFWHVTQEYFDNPDSINKYVRLPKPIQARKKSERHIPESDQMEMDIAAG